MDTEDCSLLQSVGSQRVGHEDMTKATEYAHTCALRSLDGFPESKSVELLYCQDLLLIKVVKGVR